ncbi:MAG TPA: hypothetical protein VIJ79_10225 [Acidobacteriaceae bacterium]
MSEPNETPATQSDLTALESRLTEVIRDSQTEVLRAIYGFTETVQSRLLEQDANGFALKSRVTTLESRMLDVEKRINLPPAA